QNPGRMSASDLNQFCGNCHRAPQDGPLSNWTKAWNVRHQPIYLSQSACFLKSNGALSCLTCHDSHRELDRDSAWYDQKCAGCHTSAHSRAGCIGCHMPHVSPQPHIEFTNHWIGVYAADSKLSPRRD